MKTAEQWQLEMAVLMLNDDLISNKQREHFITEIQSDAMKSRNESVLKTMRYCSANAVSHTMKSIIENEIKKLEDV